MLDGLPLVNILKLAELGMAGNNAAMKAAVDATRRRIVPWDPQQHTQSQLAANYYPPELVGRLRVTKDPYEAMNKIQVSGTRFIFDATSQLFNQHKDEVFSLNLEHRILFEEDAKNDNAVVVLGRVPFMTMQGFDRVYYGNGQEDFDENTAQYLAYIYVEAGSAREPRFLHQLLRGNVPVFPGKPILYFAREHHPEALIRTKGGFKEAIGLLAPLKSYPRHYEPSRGQSATAVS